MTNKEYFILQFKAFMICWLVLLVIPNIGTFQEVQPLVTPPPASFPLKTASYKQLTDFLAWDAGRPKSPIEQEDSYACVQFSEDFISRLHWAGYRGWVVAVNFVNSPGHAFVAVPTTDRGIIYVEPQLDDFYKYPEVGKRLSWYSNGAPVTYYGEPNSSVVTGLIIEHIAQPATCDYQTDMCW
jgi:hypothetical protein